MTENQPSELPSVKQLAEHVEITTDSAPEAPMETMWEALKANPRVVCYSVMVGMGPIVYGYDIIVSGAIVALPGFLEVYGQDMGGYLGLPALWQSLWTAFVQIGIMAGAVSGGFIQDRFGRKTSFFIGGLITAMGVAVAYGSGYMDEMLSRRIAFLWAKIGMGIGMGFLVATCQTYISEITTPVIRGPMLGLFVFMSTFGQIISITIVFKRVAMMSKSSFLLPFATQWVLSGLAMVVAFVIPESPSYLVSKSRIADAQKSYRRLHGSKADSGNAVSLLVATFEHERQVAMVRDDVTFMDCFKGTDRRRTGIIILLNVIPQFCGIAIIANGTYFMELCGMSATESFKIAEIGIGLLLASTVVCWFAMSTLGRRVIMVGSPIIVGLMYLGMGIAGCFPNSKSSPWAIGTMLILCAFFFGTGLGTAYLVVATEVSAVRLRAKSSGIAFLTNAFTAWVFAFAFPYVYTPGAGSAGLVGKTGFIFAGLSFVASLLTWTFVPETKGRSYVEIDYLFENHVKARDFKHARITDGLDNEKV